MARHKTANARVTRRCLAGLPFARFRAFDRGEFLLRTDWPADTTYLITRGQVRCFLLDRDGRDTTTAILSAGQIVGFAPFIGDPVHHKFAQAVTKVEAWSVPAEHLRQAGTSEASVGLHAMALGCLAQRLELAIALSRAVSLLSVGERIRDIQPRLAASFGANQVAVKGTTLAGLLQIRPETLARVQQAGPALEPPAIPASGQAASAIGRHSVEPDQVVLESGLPDGFVGLVVDGVLQVYVTGAHPGAILVDSLGAGDLFGTGALLGLPPTPSKLVATTTGTIEILPARELMERLAAEPAACGAFVTRCAHRLERLEQGLAARKLADLRERLIEVLRDVASSEALEDSRGARVIPSRWSHVALARRLGVCRETVTRGLATLAEAGVIAREGRRIVLVSDVPLNGAYKRSTEAPVASVHGGKCRLCGLRTNSMLCGGCAERLERELERQPDQACPKCGRHRELCQLMPCAPTVARDARHADRPSFVWRRTDGFRQPLSVPGWRRGGQKSRRAGARHHG